MKRLKLSQTELVKNEDNILGNFTSVRGEYYIPDIGKTGFYKLNGCMLDARDDEDLRELLAARLMDRIGFLHSDIILATDENGQNGCLSVNILNENEEFVEPSKKGIQYRAINNIDDFINWDLEQISSIPGINSEDLRMRKEYLLKYLLISAFISNTDIKMDNMMIIKNNRTGIFRNPEYYDMGIAFIENNDRRFFSKYSSNQVIQYLYETYPSQIVPFGKIIEEKLNQDFIESLLKEEAFDGFSSENKKIIKNQLFDRIDYVKQLNTRGENNFIFPTNEIHEISKEIPLTLRDRVAVFMCKIKNKIFGRDRDE